MKKSEPVPNIGVMPDRAHLDGTSKNSKVIIFADGGSRGNPGPAGAGAVLISSGQTIARLSKFLGVATNNIAEYNALILGLEKAQKLGFKQAEVRMDSELVVRQMNGQYRVKNSGLLPLFHKASQLVSAFSSFCIVHVRREFNSEADGLANEAMDCRK